MAVVTVAYLDWRLWISLGISFLSNFLIQYRYLASTGAGVRMNDEAYLPLIVPVQICILHALSYAYVYLTVKKSVYILLWVGILVGVHRPLEYRMLQHNLVQG